MNKAFDKVIIVIFENQYRSYVMQNTYMRKLARAGCTMNNYFGAFHPSQTNYIAALAGEVCGVTNDTPPAQPLMQQSLVALMQPNEYAEAVSWKAYMEAYPGQSWNPAWVNSNYPSDQQPLNESPDDGVNLARYFRKHNAFASFHEIQASTSRWENIVDEAQFWSDIAQGQLPEYSWFTPDIWNDGHYLYNTHIDTQPRYTLVQQLAAWLEYVFFGNIANNKVQGGNNYSPSTIGLNLDLDLVLHDPKQAYAQSRIPPGTLVVVTWDEADYNAKSYDTNYDGQNQVYTVLLGDMIKPGTQTDTPYNHYSLIKTIQYNYQLRSLKKNDASANWFRFLWHEEFHWQNPQSSPLSTSGLAALSYHQDHFVLVYTNGGGQLFYAEFKQGQWQTPIELDLQQANEIALASDGEHLVLVFSDAQERLYATSYGPGKNTPDQYWSDAVCITTGPARHLCLTQYNDYSDGKNKLMLAWQEPQSGFIFSLSYHCSVWDQQATAVGQLSGGPIAAASLGPSVYLVYPERNSFNMRITSYNTAPFNALQAQSFDGKPAPSNNTSLHQWSPMDFAVGHFARKQNQCQVDYQSNGHLALASAEGEMRLSFRGRYADTPQLNTCLFGLTGVMTASSKESNGFGTLNQAGWTLPVCDEQIQLDPDSINLMASGGGQWLQVYRPSDASNLFFRIGSYVKNHEK